VPICGSRGSGGDGDGGNGAVPGECVDAGGVTVGSAWRRPGLRDTARVGSVNAFARQSARRYAGERSFGGQGFSVESPVEAFSDCVANLVVCRCYL